MNEDHEQTHKLLEGFYQASGSDNPADWLRMVFIGKAIEQNLNVPGAKHGSTYIEFSRINKTYSCGLDNAHGEVFIGNYFPTILEAIHYSMSQAHPKNEE
jgi:hypothetical protein